jgi:Ca-activated chloride channel family protein
LSLSLLANVPAQATGMIMIDPGTMPHIVPITGPIGHGGTNHHPTVPVRPILKGGVSFGLRMQDQDVKVLISDQVARTYIKQVFANDTDRNLAGTYLFPLPADTTFSSFSLHIDGKPVEGKILEAEAARQEYEEIVRRMVDPGLLEYADYKTVRARIFPIPPHGTKTVELEYTQLLKAENGMLKYSYPLKSEGQADPLEEIKLTATLTSK